MNKQNNQGKQVSTVNALSTLIRGSIVFASALQVIRFAGAVYSKMHNTLVDKLGIADYISPLAENTAAGDDSLDLTKPYFNGFVPTIAHTAATALATVVGTLALKSLMNSDQSTKANELGETSNKTRANRTSNF